MRSALFLLTALAVSASAPAQSSEWLATWGTAVMALPSSADAAKTLSIGKKAVTVRQVVHISQGGKRVRVTFSNELGTTPLRIDAVHLAFQSAASRILLNTDRALTFNGQAGITIAPGQFASSDALVETVPIFSDLVISAVFPAQDLPTITYNAASYTTT